MNRILKRYLPELILTEEKHSDATDPCAEDFAVIDAANSYRVLACRAQTLKEGDLLPAAWGISRTELDFLERNISSHPHVILDTQKGAILVFADVLRSTGILLVARPYLQSRTLLGILRFLKRTDFLLSPTLLAQTDTSNVCSDQTMCEPIDRLLYYLDRILDQSDQFDLGFWSRCLLVAHFAGCRLDKALLSIERPALSKSDDARLTLFLLCTMLKLRQTSGRVCTEEGDLPCFFCRVELEMPQTANRDSQVAPRTDFPLLALPEFSRFSLTEGPSGLVLEAHLQDPSGELILHARSTASPCLRIWLTPTP